MTPPGTVLIRCDGSATLGLGHVVRCRALATELRERHGFEPVFVMRDDPAAADLVRGFPIAGGNPDAAGYAPWLEEAARAHDPRALVIDVRDEVPRPVLRRVRERGVVLVSIDDPSDHRLDADLVFCPPVPQVQQWDWTGFTGERFVGWEWVVLRREFAEPPARETTEPPLVLITAGGSDPGRLTFVALDALERVGEPFRAAVVIGPAFPHRDGIGHALRASARPIAVHEAPPDLRRIMTTADLAIASFGVTAYELAATGVPAVHICLTEEHAMASSAFVAAGIAVDAGMRGSVTPEDVAARTRELLRDRARREDMGRTARALVDGRGAARIADRIAQQIALRFIS